MLESLNVNTNGMLLTPDLVEPSLWKGVDLIVFGIDGFTKGTFERIRFGATRKTVYANVEYLLRAMEVSGSCPEVQIQFIEISGLRCSRWTVSESRKTSSTWAVPRCWRSGSTNASWRTSAETWPAPTCSGSPPSARWPSISITTSPWAPGERGGSAPNSGGP